MSNEPQNDQTYDAEDNSFPGDGGNGDTDETPGVNYDTGNNVNNGDGLEIADPNDFFHTRDGEDGMLPVAQKVPGRDQAFRVVPPTTGDFNKYHLDDPQRLYDDNELYAEFLNTFFIDLDEKTAADVDEGMIAYGAEAFVTMAQEAGGKDMKDALDEREMKRFMEMVGDGDGNVDFQKLVEAGDAMDE